MSNIWKDAPEGATHYLGLDGRIFDFAFFKDDKYYCEPAHTGNYVMGSSYWKVIESRPEDKPVYTQAMAESGTLPLVGMECLLSDRFDFNGPLFAGDTVIVYAIKNLPNKNTVLVGKADASGVFALSCHIKYLKPLTPPIELFNGRYYGFNYKDGLWCGIYNKDDNKFYFTDSFIVASHCTNITLLTLEK